VAWRRKETKENDACCALYITALVADVLELETTVLHVPDPTVGCICTPIMVAIPLFPITQFKSIYMVQIVLEVYRLSYYKVLIYIRYIAIKVCLIMMSIFKGEKEKESERVCLPSTVFRPSSPGPSHKSNSRASPAPTR
jgi:hypothetical protein